MSPWGLSKTGPHRAAFLQACVSDLSSSLQQLGSGLLVSVGAPEAVIASALEGAADGGNLVLTQQEVTQEETDVAAAVSRAIKVRTVSSCAVLDLQCTLLPHQDVNCVRTMIYSWHQQCNGLKACALVSSAGYS